MLHRFLNPETLSAPTGYSHVALVPAGRQVHLSGQVALDAAGTLIGADDLAAQTEQVFTNVAAGLAAAGAGWPQVFKIVTYVVGLDSSRAAVVRQVRSRHFGAGPYPASTMVGVQALVDPRLLIEIEAIALLD